MAAQNTPRLVLSPAGGLIPGSGLMAGMAFTRVIPSIPLITAGTQHVISHFSVCGGDLFFYEESVVAEQLAYGLCMYELRPVPQSHVSSHTCALTVVPCY